MEETQKIFEPTPVATPIQGEETLVTASDGSLSTPRFDEVEAQVARPVVPLAGSSIRRGVVSVRRRQWPIALVLISALAGGVVSLLAFRLYQQRQQTQAQVATQADTQTPETNAAAQTTEPPPLAQTAATETKAQPQSETPVVFEEFDPAKESIATGSGSNSSGSVDAKPARKATEADAKPAAGKEERGVDAKPAPRANAEPRPRLVEVITSPRGENVSRDERRRDEDNDAYEDRRERRRERREQRREWRRGRGRNIDRIKDIFEGPPPA